MQEQMTDFILKRTTMSGRFEEPDQIEFPTMIICAQDGMKISKLQKYGLQENKHLLQNEFENKGNPNYVGQPNQSLPETFHELSYILNRDFNLHLSHKIFLTQHYETILLKTGLNSIPRKHGQILDKYQVDPIRTFFFGTCYKIQPIDSGYWFNTHSVYLTLKLLPDQMDPVDFPKEFRIYLTSNQTWHGVIRNTWRRFNPTVKQISLGRQYIFSIKMIEKQYKDGIKDATTCFTDLMKDNANCSVVCDLQSYNNLPPCNTPEEQRCMYQNWNWKHDCLRHKKITLFNPTDRQGRYVANTTCKVKLFFDAWETQIMEEIDVISLPNLIGSIGGSLGMFFGFSITGYVMVVLERCFIKCSH